MAEALRPVRPSPPEPSVAAAKVVPPSMENWMTTLAVRGESAWRLWPMTMSPRLPVGVFTVAVMRGMACPAVVKVEVNVVARLLLARS